MTTANHESPPGALEGMRVLDVAEPLGAFVSRILGDLGADVIKIEPPGGDPGRHLSPFLTTGQERLSLPFVHANVNKRSVILDLEQRQDQERFRALVAQADVVVSTEGMAAWAARGIDVEQLSKFYPRLVWTSFSPFGLSGPYSAYTGNNIIAEAMGGLMYIQGDDAKPPCVSPYEQGLYLASLHAACGTLLALWERRTSGLGQVVEVCVHEVLANLYFLVVNYGLWSDIPYRIGARNFMPPNGYYRCQDGHVFIAALQTRQWDRLVELVGDPRLKDAALRDADYRNEYPEQVVPILQEFTARFDCWPLTQELQRHGVPAAPWSTVADVAANAHLNERGFFVDFEQPPYGRLRSAGPMFRASASPMRIRRPAPQPGEHQHEVWAEAVSQASSAPAPSVAGTRRRLPLEGIRILDLSRAWAGPYGTRYLADFGADVIKVETGKYPDGRQPGNPGYEEINRNKRPITLNFQFPEGQELLKRLVAISDVVVENFSPRVMAQYQLDYDHLLQGASGSHHGQPAGLWTQWAAQSVRQLRRPVDGLYRHVPAVGPCRFTTRRPYQGGPARLHRGHDPGAGRHRCPASSRPHGPGPVHRNRASGGHRRLHGPGLPGLLCHGHSRDAQRQSGSQRRAAGLLPLRGA